MIRHSINDLALLALKIPSNCPPPNEIRAVVCEEATISDILESDGGYRSIDT